MAGTVLADVEARKNCDQMVRVVGQASSVTWYPFIDSALSTANAAGTVTWSTPSTAASGTTDTTLSLGTCNMRRNEQFGPFTNGPVSFNVTLGLATTQTGATAQVKFRARDIGAAAWSTIMSADGSIAVESTTEVFRTYAGMLGPTTNFTKTPFEVQLIHQANDATALSVARIQGGTCSWIKFSTEG